MLARQLSRVFGSDKTNQDVRVNALLGYALVLAWKRTISTASGRASVPLSPLEILEEPRVSHALMALPEDKRERFSSWFKNRTDTELQMLFETTRKDTRTLQEQLNTIAASLFTKERIKSSGSVFTPEWLAHVIVREGLRQWQRLNPGKGLPRLTGDLSCGPGVFLQTLHAFLGTESKIVGVDICPEYVYLARLGSLGRDNTQIVCSDTLLELSADRQGRLFSHSMEGVPREGYDLLVGNPPYVRSQLIEPRYASALRQAYPEYTAGNFDLTVTFIAHHLDALKDGGVAAVIVSSKFMSSRYGKTICERLARENRILKIVDFGDGQVFPNHTTYTSILVFAKLPPAGSTTVVKFPPGKKWHDGARSLQSGRESQLPQKQLRSHPWQLTSGENDEILERIQTPNMPLLTDVFPQVAQGLRTGANSVFILSSQKERRLDLESDLLRPFVTGAEIRRMEVLPSHRRLLWPYERGLGGEVSALDPEDIKKRAPRIWEYLCQQKDVLSDRQLEKGASWYTFSRSQNLGVMDRPKILVREMMPRSEFAADLDGRYSFGSGYALVAPFGMSEEEITLWTAILNTPTMEFQFRLTCTHLRNGWYRVLKHHLRRIRLPKFLPDQWREALELARVLSECPNDTDTWEKLDAVVSDAFGLSARMRATIREYLAEVHEVSIPVNQINTQVLSDDRSSIFGSEDSEGETMYPDLTPEQRKRFLPVELTRFNALHRERKDLAGLTTFRANKQGAPRHRWYQFTQGFSEPLVAHLLTELDVSTDETVYDPFVGSGTTVIACRARGIRAIGSDISPLMTWITKVKSRHWDDTTALRELVAKVESSDPEHVAPAGLLFMDYLSKAFAPQILAQLVGWREWIKALDIPCHQRDFLLMGLISILESVSLVRKHGSHYRYLNKVDNVGVGKLNIPVFDSSSSIRPVLLDKLQEMVSDVETYKMVAAETDESIFTIDVREQTPKNHRVDVVITSPPYLNRNNYFAQQKAEISILGLVNSYVEYKQLVKQSFRSHVESRLDQQALSTVPEVNRIIEAVELSSNNNPRIPHMIAGYFDDMHRTLSNLRTVLSRNARLAFVVGNSRWGGVVVPVDHLVALIAERLGYSVERILVTRYKGNSPQQMARYGRIPVRESIVLLRWN